MTTGRGRDQSTIRGWERLLIGLFALLFVAIDSGNRVIDIIVRSAAWFVVLAALGAVEVAMALYYRARRTAHPSDASGNR